ncbi:hypothetical protein M569_10466 [Genlisea aurea]|uniref:ABC transmembrane type-1 domain-containing protein n=1 Tax=Genlisea aurea TaxID=192259 RepID=S8CI24_9LAMI|nr:hypothetical protein M569_10466 [Genlisea aurea]
MGVSGFSSSEDPALVPFELLNLAIEFISWCSMVIMLLLETKIYVKEFRWYIRFGMIYVLVGDAVVLHFLPLRASNLWYFQYLLIGSVFFQILLGLLLLVYVPKLGLYPGYIPLPDSLDDRKSEKHLAEEVCPERYVNVFSRIYFDWMTPLMQLGYRKPITEKDVWRLDSWDQTETLSKNFQKSWVEEIKRPKPCLLHALNNSLGGRFWFGGFFKIGNDLSQLAGPVLLNHLLKSLESGEPAWIGYIYALSIFFTVSIGVLCESQYFQNVMRVGFRLRSTLVAAVFRKSLRLTHESRKNFPSGKITNMMTTDANALQQICQQLHGLWSAPFRITMAMVLLYQQLGVASLIGSLMLVLLFPLQTFIISKMRKQAKEGLIRTDRRVGLMNEIIAAMDTVKYEIFWWL